MGNNNEDYSSLELRSEEVQELMSKRPSWILRRGIGVILFLLGCAFVACKYVPYTDELQVNVIIPPNIQSKRFVNTKDGEILYLKQGLQTKALRGDTLVIIAYSDDTISFISPFDGLVYKSGVFKNGDIISAGELSVAVSDGNIMSTKSYAYSYVNAEQISKLKYGMVMTTDNHQHSYKIKELSPIPNEKGWYTVVYVENFKKSEVNIVKQEKTGYIQLDSSNVYDKFFAQRINNVISRE